MRQSTLSVFFGGMLLLLGGCNFREEKGLISAATSGKFATIQQKILGPRCMSCHAGPGAADGIDLSSYVALLRSGSVVASRPEESSLYTSVAGGRMPKNRQPLGEEDKELIRAWIAEGARETDTSPPAENRPQPTYAWISKNLFESRCVVCHNAQKPRGKVNLVDYAGLAASNGNHFRPVVAGDPEKSGVFVTLAEKKMPPEPRKVTVAETRALHDWIANGALEVTPGTVLPPVGEPQGPPQANYEWLSRNLLNRRCGSCHGIPYKVASVDFTNHHTLLASPAKGIRAITPGDPGQSSVYLEVILGHMPPKRRAVTDEEVEVVRQWIRDGAKNN